MGLDPPPLWMWCLFECSLVARARAIGQSCSLSPSHFQNPGYSPDQCLQLDTDLSVILMIFYERVLWL